MKQLLQNMKTGLTEIIEVPVPTVKPGTVLVKTAASLVSAGTERMLVEFAEKSLVGKARSRPDLVRQVIDKAKREGIATTVEAAFNRLDQPFALGYSSAGMIIEVGEGVSGYRVGQRVACAGGGYAVHAEFVIVPQNLISPLPDSVDFDAAAFATLGSIALHGFRLAEPQFGDRIAIIGLGLLGLLATGIAVAAGVHVIGIDLDPGRVKLGESLGAYCVTREQAETATETFSRGRGVDSILICADTPSDDPVVLAGEIARDRANVVAVGAVGLNIPRKTYFQKELNFVNSRSYGPGRYDTLYEEKGIDYPIGYVRWTEGRNLEAFIDLLESGRFDVGQLITHRFKIDDAPSAYELITTTEGEPFLGVILQYPEDRVEARNQYPQKTIEGDRSKSVQLGVLGAGNFASGVMLPAICKIEDVTLQGIASATGVSAQHIGNKFEFEYACSDESEIIQDQNINTLAILTRHDLHYDQIAAGLKAKKHVFVEKPPVINLEQLKKLESLILNEGFKQQFTVGYNRRFAPLVMKMKDALDQSQEPMVMHYRVNAGLLPLNHWLHDPEIGGGRIVGEACHFIDLLVYLSGKSPVDVYAQGTNDLGKYRDDNIQITITFSDSSLGTVLYLANGDRSVPKEYIEVFKGGVVAVLDDFRSLTVVRNGKKKTHRSWLSQDKGHQAEWEAFANAISSGGPPTIPYEDIIAVSKVSFAALESLQTGRPVRLSS